MRLAFLAALLVLAVTDAPLADATAASKPVPQAAADAVFVHLSFAGQARVRRVPSGHELELDDGRMVRLAEVIAPLPDPDDAVVTGWARTAQDMLRQMLQDRPVELWLERPTADRYGRLAAHLRDKDHGWIQARLVALGYARVLPTADAAAATAALFTLEDQARAEGRGLWRYWRFEVHPAERVRLPAGDYGLVEGTVAAAAKVGGTLYLNFGDDWREDFTVRLDWDVRRRLPAEQRLAEWWTGRRLQVRGAIEYFNGPMITLGHPAQLRILEAPLPADRSAGETTQESR